MADKETSMGGASNHVKKASTLSERLKKHREKKKQNDPTYATKESKRVEACRKKRVLNMTEKERDSFRKKVAERVAKCRQKKKLEDSQTRVVETTTASGGKGFKTKQALSKAVNKVLFSFPASPSKKIATFSGVAKHTDKAIDQATPWQDVEVPGIRKVHCMIGKACGEVTLLSTNNGEVMCKVYIADKELGTCASIPSKEIQVNIGDWVIVSYDGKEYPGEVTGKGETSLRVNVMRPTFTGNWKWPDMKDEIYSETKSVLRRITPPVPIGSRGQFKFESM